MDEGLTATTARPITFLRKRVNSTLVLDSRRVPAETEVYARVNRRNRLVLRIPGTLLEAEVGADDVLVP